MCSRPCLLRFVGGALPIVTLVCAVVAQEQTARTSYSRMLNIDALIDNHARFLARRYNLSADQDAFTQAFLREKTDAFLAKHREELFDLVDRLVEVRSGGEMDTQELIAWGRQALPLYEQAKALITEGNDTWREILTEEQRRVHDEDLREMHESFATTESQLQRMVSGQMTVEEFRRGPTKPRGDTRPEPTPKPPPPTPTVTPTPSSNRPAPVPVTRAPEERRPGPDRRPVTPDTRAHLGPGGSTSTAVRRLPVGQAGSDPVSQWEAYVRDFIQRYQLDEAQTARANAILKECQELANRQIERRKPELERIDRKVQELAQSTAEDKVKQLTELNERRTKLFEPVHEIFEKQLKPRLERLPTRAQRQAAEQGGKSPMPGKPEPGSRPTPTPVQRPQPTPPPTPPPTQPPQPEPVPPPEPSPVEEPAPEPPPENPPE